MPHAPEHQEIVNAIIDQELEVAKLVKDASEASSTTKGRLKQLARHMVEMRARGASVENLKATFVKAFMLLGLLEYTANVHEIKRIVDANLEAQLEAIKKYGKPLHTIAPIHSADIKRRAMEKAGALADGMVKKDG